MREWAKPVVGMENVAVKKQKKVNVVRESVAVQVRVKRLKKASVVLENVVVKSKKKQNVARVSADQVNRWIQLMNVV
jgi:hypothetical protein